MGEGLVTVAIVEAGEPDHAGGTGGLLERVRERVQPYGGAELRGSAHEVAAVFPTPRQALSFAMAVQAATGGADPGPRIGITVGESAGGETSNGQVAAAARHLTRRAASGEVMVCDVVRHLAGANRAVRFTDRGPLQLGAAVTGRAFAAAIGRSPPGSAAVFGRSAELEVIDRLLAELATGSGRVVVIEGEAGIGKTHLVGAAADRARAGGATVLQGRGDELERDRPGRILMALAEGLGLNVQGLLTEPEGLGGSRGFAVIEAVIDAVDDASADAPLVVVAEDLHWADELSLRGIAALCRQVRRLPIAVVVTLRPHPRPSQLDAVLRSVEPQQCPNLRLRGLDAAGVASIVASRTGAAPGPVLSSRLAGAAGNPLFVIELLNGFVADDALRVAAGVVETTARGVPSTFGEAILRRLSSLPPDTLELLRLGSLLGREFTLADLATVAARSIIECAGHLHDAVRADVLAGDGDRLRFRHDLIRHAVYDDLVPAIRRDMHVAAGRALQAAGAPAQQVARQFAMGARVGDLDAIEWLERAAHEALYLDAGAAADLLLRAVSLAPPGEPERDRLEAALLEPLAWSGRVVEARERATELLDRRLESADEFAARRGFAAVLATVGDIAAAAGECERAASVSGAPPDQRALLRCVAAGMSILVSGTAEAVSAAAQGHLDDAERREDRALACWSHQALGLAALAAARYDDALAHVRSSRRILDAGWVPAMGFLIPHLWEGSVLGYLDRFGEGIGAYRTARGRAAARGETGLLVLVHAGTGGLHYLCGEWDEAVSEVEAGMALADETGARAMTLLSHAILARIALGRGDLEVAEHHVTAGVEVIGTTGHRYGVDMLAWAQAGLLEARGQTGAARDVLVDLWQQIAPIRFLMQYRNVGPDLIRLLRQTGECEQAEHVARQLEAAARCNTSASCAAAALRARGLADAESETLLLAVQRYRDTPRRLELAGSCEDAAAALLADGRRTEALALLDEAAAVHVSVGAHHDLARVDARARAHGRRRRSRRPADATGWDALSDKEREVVELIARGLTNPEIGRHLFISRRTVETHLSHIFKKLGVENRVQLAAARLSRASPADVPPDRR